MSVAVEREDQERAKVPESLRLPTRTRRTKTRMMSSSLSVLPEEFQSTEKKIQAGIDTHCSIRLSVFCFICLYLPLLNSHTQPAVTLTLSIYFCLSRAICLSVDASLSHPCMGLVSSLYLPLHVHWAVCTHRPCLLLSLYACMYVCLSSVRKKLIWTSRFPVWSAFLPSLRAEVPDSPRPSGISLACSCSLS